MSNLLKLFYVVVTPGAIILAYDNVIVVNWSTWISQHPLLAGIPSWAFLAVMTLIFGATVGVLCGINWFRVFHRSGIGASDSTDELTHQSAKIQKFEKD